MPQIVKIPLLRPLKDSKYPNAYDLIEVTFLGIEIVSIFGYP